MHRAATWRSAETRPVVQLSASLSGDRSPPHTGWNAGDVLGLPGNAPYILLLSIMSLLSMVIIWWVLSLLLYSPWGRILKSIREDEEVSLHHGNNVLMHKAISLGLGASIAAFGGILWAWLNTAIWPDFLNPVRSTFLVWAAFILGGRGNNRGMFIGAFIIVIIEFIFNVMIVSRTNTDIFLHSITGFLDSVFRWVIVDIGGIIWSDLSISESFLNGKIILELSYFGCLGLAGRTLNPDGMPCTMGSPFATRSRTFMSSCVI